MALVDGKIAQRYAVSLFQVAKEQGNVREVWAQLTTVNTLVKQHPVLKKFADNPLISQKDKQSVCEDILKQVDIHNTLIRFVRLLIENNRLKLLSKILYFYGQRAQESFRSLTVQVYSVAPLNQGVQKVLAEYLKNIFHHDVELICKIDRSILGGLLIKLQNRVMDFSIKSELNRIKEVLKQEG